MFKTLSALALFLPAIAWGGKFGITFTGGPGIAGSSKETIFGLHSLIKLSYSFKRFEFGSYIDISGGPPLSHAFAGVGAFLNRKGTITDNAYYYYGINADIIEYGSVTSATTGGIHGGFVKILNKHWEFIAEAGVNLGPGNWVEEEKVHPNPSSSGSFYYKYRDVPVTVVYIPVTFGVRCNI